jgi:hypothetical protein
MKSIKKLLNLKINSYYLFNLKYVSSDIENLGIRFTKFDSAKILHFFKNCTILSYNVINDIKLKKIFFCRFFKYIIIRQIHLYNVFNFNIVLYFLNTLFYLLLYRFINLLNFLIIIK